MVAIKKQTSVPKSSKFLAPNWRNTTVCGKHKSNNEAATIRSAVDMFVLIWVNLPGLDKNLDGDQRTPVDAFQKRARWRTVSATLSVGLQLRSFIPLSGRHCVKGAHHLVGRFGIKIRIPKMSGE